MRDYQKPIIEEEEIELEDIIATSMNNPEDDFDPEKPGDEILL